MLKFKESRELLGTHITLHIVGESLSLAAAASDAAFKECDRLEKTYSRFIQGNYLAEVNAHVGEWQEVNSELYLLLEYAQEAHRLTDGAFDLSVKTILEGWGYDADYSLKESEAGRQGAIELKEGMVLLQAPIELGGLGKGYAIDQMRDILSDFTDFCIDAGGDIFAQGQDEEGPWRMMFEDPRSTEKTIGYVDVNGFAVASSSPLRRHWRNRHHLVDPRSAEPAGNMQAVYTQAADGLTADVYSTALFVLGYEEALKKLPMLPVKAMLISPKGEIFRSEGFEGRLYL